MGSRDYWKPGEWNARCDQSGQKMKSSEMVLQWDGLRVRKRSLDPRSPQDLIRPPKEQQWLPWTRPDPAPIFVTGTTISVNQLIDGFILDSVMCG